MAYNLAFEPGKQEDQELNTTLSYIMSSREPGLQRSCYRTKVAVFNSTEWGLVNGQTEHLPYPQDYKLAESQYRNQTMYQVSPYAGQNQLEL